MSNRSPVTDDKPQKMSSTAEDNLNRLEKYKESVNKFNMREKMSQYAIKYLEEKLEAAEERESARKKKLSNLKKATEEAVEKNTKEMDKLQMEKIDLEGCLQLSDSLNAEIIVEQLEVKDELRQLKEEQDKMKEELSALRREEALSKCKICYDRTVEIVLYCGHPVCDVCYYRIDECHFCRTRNYQRNPKRLYLT